jgi:peroxiredoxin Q/BCP
LRPWIDKFAADQVHAVFRGDRGEKMNYGKTYMGVIRTTFVIDGTGTIEKIFTKVDTKEHTNQIIKDLSIN